MAGVEVLQRLLELLSSLAEKPTAILCIEIDSNVDRLEVQCNAFCERIEH